MSVNDLAPIAWRKLSPSGQLKSRAVLRDVGRVLQIPYPVVDRLCKMVPNIPTNPVTLQQAIGRR